MADLLGTTSANVRPRSSGSGPPRPSCQPPSGLLGAARLLADARVNGSRAYELPTASLAHGPRRLPRARQPESSGPTRVAVVCRHLVGARPRPAHLSPPSRAVPSRTGRGRLSRCARATAETRLDSPMDSTQRVASCSALGTPWHRPRPECVSSGYRRLGWPLDGVAIGAAHRPAQRRPRAPPSAGMGGRSPLPCLRRTRGRIDVATQDELNGSPHRWEQRWERRWPWQSRRLRQDGLGTELRRLPRSPDEVEDVARCRTRVTSSNSTSAHPLGTQRAGVASAEL